MVLRRLSVHVRQIPLRRPLGAALVACLLAATACTKVGTNSGAGGDHPYTQAGTMRIALYTAPNSLNPILTSDTAEVMVDTAIFDPLVTVDPKGNDVPVLASEVPTQKNGDISADGKTITYKLRHNVKWHDGAPFSSADVKFSWQAVMNNKNNVVSRRGYDLVGSVDTPDAYTVVFHMKQAFAPAIDTLFSVNDSPMLVLPQHLLAKYPDINQIPFNSEPVGTGPFKFAQWVRGDRIELTANPDYFLGKPKLNRLIIKIISDGNTAMTEMRNHEVDALVEVTGSQYRDLKNAPDVVFDMPQSPQYEGIGMNLSRAPLSDIHVRQAIAHAIDAAKIRDTTQFGLGIPATEDVPSYSWAYNPNVTKYDYNPAKAASILDAAGWKAGPNGIRQKAGAPLSLQLVYGQGSTAAQNIAVLVQSQLKAVGIEVPVKTYNFTQLYASYQMGGIYNTGKFDLNIYAWVEGADPDDSSSFMCGFIPPKGNNVFHFCNAQFDAAQTHALSTYDRAARKADYAKTQQIMSDVIPMVYLFYRHEVTALSPDVKGFSNNGIVETWNAYQWSI